MSRLNISKARDLWRDAIAETGWQSSTLEKVMFDWQKGKPTRYHPNPPAFYSISDELDTVDEADYLELQAELIRRGDRFSDLGRTRGSGVTYASPLCVHPAACIPGEIQATIGAVMASVHPAVVTQEQILRCAFIAHLPEATRKAIGMLSANLHPEIPTASKEYQRKGRTKRRARIDLGFGHPTKCEEVTGVVELKAITSFNEMWFQKQLEKIESTPKNLMFSGIAGDFEKLLDAKLPSDAFRYSWAVTKKRSTATPEQIAQWAQSLLKPVEQRLALRGFKQNYDAATGWLQWSWQDGPRLHLAWYWPKRQNSEQFETVWSSH